jgi:CMP-N,N'-diacetyllegionaminic acid synthase
MGNILALIPARGGSKRLPGKNIRSFLGRPLISWVIEAALDVASVDKVLVSTDSPEISEVALRTGANVPFLRPSILAGDEAKSEEVVGHAIEFLERIGESYDTLVLLQATSPLTSAEHIEAALKLFNTTGAQSVISVVRNAEPTRSTVSVKVEHGIISTVGEDESVYSLNGSIFIAASELMRTRCNQKFPLI